MSARLPQLTHAQPARSPDTSRPLAGWTPKNWVFPAVWIPLKLMQSVGPWEAAAGASATLSAPLGLLGGVPDGLGWWLQRQHHGSNDPDALLPRRRWRCTRCAGAPAPAPWRCRWLPSARTSSWATGGTVRLSGGGPCCGGSCAPPAAAVSAGAGPTARCMACSAAVAGLPAPLPVCTVVIPSAWLVVPETAPPLPPPRSARSRVLRAPQAAGEPALDGRLLGEHRRCAGGAEAPGRSRRVHWRGACAACADGLPHRPCGHTSRLAAAAAACCAADPSPPHPPPAGTIAAFHPVSRTAALLMAPTQLWVTIAAKLNYDIVQLNKGKSRSAGGGSVGRVVEGKQEGRGYRWWEWRACCSCQRVKSRGRAMFAAAAAG